MNQRARFYEIDLFRFLAAMGVVLFHYTFRGYAADGLSPLSFPYLAEVFKYGYLGVNLFFMISGFVILLTALDKDFKGFVISRITRLYPAFWAGVTITALAIVFLGGSRFTVGMLQYLGNLSMVGGYFGVKAVDGVYWTLLVEIRFYFLVGIILLLGQIDKTKGFLLLWLLASILDIFIRIPAGVRVFLIPQWSSYFIAGAMCYLVRREGPSGFKLTVIAIAYYLSVRHACWRIPRMEEHYHTVFSGLATSAIISLFYVAMLLVSLGKSQFINKKQMLALGVLTYPLYLVHQNLGFMLFNAWGEVLNKYLMLLLVIGVMILVAYLIHKYVENVASVPLARLLHSVAQGGEAYLVGSIARMASLGDWRSRKATIPKVAYGEAKKGGALGGNGRPHQAHPPAAHRHGQPYHGAVELARVDGEAPGDGDTVE